MKRILFAAVVALGIHGLLFGMEFSWLHNKLPNKPKPHTLTMSLTYREPQRSKSKHVIRKPDIPSKKIVHPKKTVKKKKPRPIPRPKPAKKVLKPPEIVKNIEQPSPPSEPQETEAVEEPDDSSPEFTEDIIREDVSMVVGGSAGVADVPLMREATPLYRKNPTPKYPKIARKRGYQGTVVIEVLVDRDGRVGDLRVSESSGYSILDRAAMASVKGWVFEPGMKGDQKVDMWVKVPIRFQLK
ncbi:MAG: energy transducer TonB [Deltaproteobacteria bacterium]|nr:energy transducer TonB [Deltaproteobacteria bacterium]